VSKHPDKNYKAINCLECGGDVSDCSSCSGTGKATAYYSGTVRAYPRGPIAGRLTNPQICALFADVSPVAALQHEHNKKAGAA
jgi:hypothetical protein